MTKLLEIIKNWSLKGMHLPFVHDPVSGQPSITLWFCYLTFTLAMGSAIMLHLYKGLLVATSVSIIFWAIAVVFYLIRKITKAKFDLQSKSLELEGENEQKVEIPKNL